MCKVYNSGIKLLSVPLQLDLYEFVSKKLTTGHLCASSLHNKEGETSYRAEFQLIGMSIGLHTTRESQSISLTTQQRAACTLRCKYGYIIGSGTTHSSFPFAWF